MSSRALGGAGWVAIAGLLLTGCASTGTSAEKAAKPIRMEIVDVLTRQAAAWNAGNVEAFMEPYWHSEQLSFCSGGKITRGYQGMLDRYRKNYPTRQAMGTLTFTGLEVRELTPRAALVLGRWEIKGSEPNGGRFTLVFEKRAEGWVIIHDHTSSDKE